MKKTHEKYFPMVGISFFRNKNCNIKKINKKKKMFKRNVENRISWNSTFFDDYDEKVPNAKLLWAFFKERKTSIGISIMKNL